MGEMVRVYGLGGAFLDGVEYKPEADGALVVPASAVALLVHAHGGTLVPPEAPKSEPAAATPKGRVLNGGLSEGAGAGDGGRRKR